MKEQNLKAKSVVIGIDYFNRLKRLDENVKKKIADYKKCVDGVFGDDYLSKIELLESLDKLFEEDR